MASEVIDLPQPDSPTRPIVSPSRTVKETLSTIAVSPKRPGKRMDRFLTSRTLRAPAGTWGRRSVRLASMAASSSSSLSSRTCGLAAATFASVSRADVL
ncbi:hypothetical protein D9M72_497820 [compost metagenome]